MPARTPARTQRLADRFFRVHCTFLLLMGTVVGTGFGQQPTPVPTTDAASESGFPDEGLTSDGGAVVDGEAAGENAMILDEPAPQTTVAEMSSEPVRVSLAVIENRISEETQAASALVAFSDLTGEDGDGDLIDQLIRDWARRLEEARRAADDQAGGAEDTALGTYYLRVAAPESVCDAHTPGATTSAFPSQENAARSALDSSHDADGDSYTPVRPSTIRIPVPVSNGQSVASLVASRLLRLRTSSVASRVYWKDVLPKPEASEAQGNLSRFNVVLQMATPGEASSPATGYVPPDHLSGFYWQRASESPTEQLVYEQPTAAWSAKYLLDLNPHDPNQATLSIVATIYNRTKIPWCDGTRVVLVAKGSDLAYDLGEIQLGEETAGTFPVMDVYPRHEMVTRAASPARRCIAYGVALTEQDRLIVVPDDDTPGEPGKLIDVPPVFFDRSVSADVVRWGEIKSLDGRLPPEELDTGLGTLLLKNGRVIGERSSLVLVKTGFDSFKNPTVALKVEPLLDVTAKASDVRVVRTIDVSQANLAAGEKTEYALKRAAEASGLLEAVLIRHRKGSGQILCYSTGDAAPVCEKQQEVHVWMLGEDEVKFIAFLHAKDPTTSVDVRTTSSDDLKKIVVTGHSKTSCTQEAMSEFWQAVVSKRAEIETQAKMLEAVGKMDAKLQELEGQYVVDQATYGDLLTLNSYRRRELQNRLVVGQGEIVRLQNELQLLLLNHTSCVK